MSGVDKLLQTLQAIRRTPAEQITRGALGQKAHYTSLWNRDLDNQLRINAAETLAAAKERQPGMGDVELMQDDDVRIGDEYHINVHGPAAEEPAAGISAQSVPANLQATGNMLGTVGSMAAGAALLAGGAGLAQVPALLSSSDPPAAVAPVVPGSHNDADTTHAIEIRGGIELPQER